MPRKSIDHSSLSIPIGIIYSFGWHRRYAGILNRSGKCMSILKKIEVKLDAMAPGDREIGQYILDNPDQMLRLSTAALAAEIGRSQSSVVKFSQKLGYASYQEALTDLLFILLVQRRPDANEFVHNSEMAVSVLKADRSS